MAVSPIDLMEMLTQRYVVGCVSIELPHFGDRIEVDWLSERNLCYFAFVILQINRIQDAEGPISAPYYHYRPN